MSAHPLARRFPWAAAILLLATAAVAQDAPKVAGTDVAPPKRTKFVAPEYPPDAQARGVRGIVILELLIDEQGKVSSVEVIRSIAGLDEAAIGAVRKWEFEVTKVDGKPVRVRHTVPITFALKLPEVTRQQGIPELRQGAAPPFPQGASENPAKVVAEVTLDGQGNVTEAQVKSGESPFAEALIQALRTWRFQPPGDEATVSFRVTAEFIPGSKGAPGRVALDLSGLQRSESMAAAPQPDAAPTAPAPVADATPPPAAPPANTPAAGTPPSSPPAAPTEPVAAPPSGNPPEAAPAPKPASPQPASPQPASPQPTSPEPASPTSPPPAKTPPATTPAPADASAGSAAPPLGAKQAAPPAIEVIRAPSPSPAPRPLEPGVSAVRDVTLAVGVPDLMKGRRPVVPPLARMGSMSGHVEVHFAVDAAGNASVTKVEGPDPLKEAAQQTVASWSFRRTTAERLRMVADLAYEGDGASAKVQLEEQPQQP